MVVPSPLNGGAGPPILKNGWQFCALQTRLLGMIKTFLSSASVCGLLFSVPAIAQHDPARLRDAAMNDQIAWNFVEDLTTEVGPRLAATKAEARARDWAAQRLEELGFSDVRIETYDMPTWIRGQEKAWIISPFPQPMLVTALGTSGSTGPEGLEADVTYFPSYADLVDAPAGSISGKIAFIDHHMKPTQDGSGYGFAGPARWTGPGIAAQKGAVATVIRSIGTENDRTPHTGGTSFADGVKHIPAAALSNPDADNLVRMIERGGAVSMKLVLTPQDLGLQESGNVIADVRGKRPDLPMVLIACHLDSWDLGTGAIDDGAGCGIIAAAAKRVMDAGPPLRTIRLLFAGAEEVGVYGGKAYADLHKHESHGLAMESDFGADRVWKVDFNLPGTAAALQDEIAKALAPIGIATGQDSAHGGADIGPTIQMGKTSVIDLKQDGLRYFDLHHTPNDTLDKIDPAQLAQNVAAWTTVLSIAANTDLDLTRGPGPKPPSE